MRSVMDGRELLCHCGKPLSVAKFDADKYVLGHLDSVDCMALTGDAEDVLSAFLENGIPEPTKDELEALEERKQRARLIHEQRVASRGLEGATP